MILYSGYEELKAKEEFFDIVDSKEIATAFTGKRLVSMRMKLDESRNVDEPEGYHVYVDACVNKLGQIILTRRHVVPVRVDFTKIECTNLECEEVDSVSMLLDFFEFDSEDCSDCLSQLMLLFFNPSLFTGITEDEDSCPYCQREWKVFA